MKLKKNVMTEFHKQNMKRHIKFLRDNADKIRESFTMKRLEHVCGGPACSLGFATLSVEKLRCEESYTAFSKRVFGIDPCSGEYQEERIGDYMFSQSWLSVNNTPEAAASRMEAVLYDQVPEHWAYTEEFSHPIVLIPSELEQANKLKPELI